jgi:hypothetical protein
MAIQFPRRAETRVRHRCVAHEDHWRIPDPAIEQAVRRGSARLHVCCGELFIGRLGEAAAHPARYEVAMIALLQPMSPGGDPQLIKKRSGNGLY